jgi:hypothetical protein
MPFVFNVENASTDNFNSFNFVFNYFTFYILQFILHLFVIIINFMKLFENCRTVIRFMNNQFIVLFADKNEIVL